MSALPRTDAIEWCIGFVRDRESTISDREGVRHLGCSDDAIAQLVALKDRSLVLDMVVRQLPLHVSASIFGPFAERDEDGVPVLNDDIRALLERAARRAT